MKCLQQVKNLKYLSCGIPYEKEEAIQHKVAKCAQILVILNNTFKQTLVQKSSRVKVYNGLNVFIILHGNDIWALRQKDKND
jgi:hypothetical protein